MYTRVLGLTIAAAMLAYGVVGATAQDRMATQPNPQQMQSPMGQEDPMEEGGMMGRHGMMGHHGTMMRIIFILTDTDGDGTISLPEFQAAHERLFHAMDTNNDGKLTPEEIRAFMHGTK